MNRISLQDFSNCPRCGGLFNRGKKRATLSQRRAYCSQDCFEAAANERREKIEDFILRRRESVLLREEKENFYENRVMVNNGFSENISDEEYRKASNHFDRIIFLGRYFSKRLGDHFTIISSSKDGRRLVYADRNVNMKGGTAYPDLVLRGKAGQENVYGEVGNLNVEKIVQFYSNKRLFWNSCFGDSKDDLLLFFDHLVLRRFSLGGLADFLLGENVKSKVF